MRKPRCSAVFVAIGCVLIASSMYGLQAQDSKTAKDAVFSAAQAARGGTLYQDQCAACHAADLSGGGAPQLAGADFLGSWDKSPVSDLASKIASTMPASSPGSLSRQQATDIVAIVVASNKFPAGSTDLPADEAAQKAIVIAK